MINKFSCTFKFGWFSLINLSIWKYPNGSCTIGGCGKSIRLNRQEVVNLKLNSVKSEEDLTQWVNDNFNETTGILAGRYVPRIFNYNFRIETQHPEKDSIAEEYGNAVSREKRRITWIENGQLCSVDWNNPGWKDGTKEVQVWTPAFSGRLLFHPDDTIEVRDSKDKALNGFINGLYVLPLKNILAIFTARDHA